MTPDTIPSRALAVWRRLYTRYALEPGPASVGPDVLKTIIPVTQADLLLARHRGVVDETTVVGVGAHLAHTVPQGLRRAVVTLLAVRTGGTWTLDLVNVIDVSEGATVRISTQAASDNLFLPAHSAPIVLEEGDQISINIATHSVDGTCRLEVWVIDEDLF